MHAVALDTGNTVVVRRSTLEWILFGVLGILALTVSGWTGKTLMTHETRLSAIEARQSETHAMCQSVERTVITINDRLGNIERILMEGRTASEENGGGT